MNFIYFGFFPQNSKGLSTVVCKELIMVIRKKWYTHFSATFISPIKEQNHSSESPSQIYVLNENVSLILSCCF